ncbi:MAG: DUF177 domain-containing protein [Candidatus Neomarinimicrobiota bacterium]
MKLRGTDMLEESETLALMLDASDLGLDDMNLVSETITVEMRVNQTESDIVMRARATLVARETCDRCLSPFDSRMDVTFQLMLTEKELLLEGGKDSDIYFFPANEQELNLGPPLRDAILLERSMKQVCSETCRGICPQCGTNLNQDTCDCGENGVDERWAALRQINLSRTE